MCNHEETAGFSLCRTCLECEYRISLIIKWLSNDSDREEFEKKLKLYSLIENNSITRYEQAMPNVPLASYDCDLAKQAFLKDYLIRPDDIIELKNVSFQQIKRAEKQLNMRIENDKETGYLVVYILAGHGIQRDGNQTLLTNEFDKQQKFYKCYPVEKLMRIRAKNYANSFHLGIFACCREAEKKEYNFLPKSEVHAYYDFEMAKRLIEGNLTRDNIL